MNLDNLKWIKNVKRDDNKWAYPHHEINQSSKTFNLHWKLEQQDNAQKPQEKDLIILKQHGKITHIVQLLDTYTKNDDFHQEQWIYRIVKAVWMANIWNEPPNINDVFKCNINFYGGSVINLKNIKTLNEKWDLDNGMNRFYDHVTNKLKLDQSVILAHN